LKKHQNISEENLIDLLRNRNEEGISILYDNYSATLYGIIFRIVLYEDIAEDILQDAFLKIWNNFAQYDSSKGRLFTWMMNICRNLAIDKVRSKGFNNSLKNRSLDNIVSFVELNNNYINNPDHIGVKELINKLTPEQKKIIDLLYFKGYTQTEVAEELNMPLGTVKTRARLAINTLRKEFGTAKVIKE
jgi:RNA polymerase sigma factor (sigma-70 family)